MNHAALQRALVCACLCKCLWEKKKKSVILSFMPIVYISPCIQKRHYNLYTHSGPWPQRIFDILWHCGLYELGCFLTAWPFVIYSSNHTALNTVFIPHILYTHTLTLTLLSLWGHWLTIHSLPITIITLTWHKLGLFPQNSFHGCLSESEESWEKSSCRLGTYTHTHTHTGSKCAHKHTNACTRTQATQNEVWPVQKKHGRQLVLWRVVV